MTGTRLRFDQDDPQQGVFLPDSAKKAYRMEKILSHTGT
ncbi:MAG: hypothetical protein LBF05_01935 [Tannerella sp.]|nr:hypothetical protein [Tannerella sp.]